MKSKTRISLISLMSGLLLSSTLTAQPLDPNPHWIEYGSEPVAIRQVNNGASQTLQFVAFRDGMLVANLEGGVGEASFPVSESMVQTLQLEIKEIPAVERLIAVESYDRALDTLRPVVYPLIKFHQVPESFTQLHRPIQLLVSTLLDAEKYPEADDVLSRIQLNEVSLDYSRLAIRLMKAYMQNGNPSAGARIAGVLPVDGRYAQNIRSIVDAADSLRASGEYEAVIPLYREIEKVVSDAAKPNVRMWLAYCLVLAGRIDEADPMIDSLQEPEPNQRLFSLYMLLKGSRQHSTGNYRLALDVLTRGFVRAQASYDWVPEMLYLIGDCYARSAENTAARNVWSEVVILYPDSPWASPAESSLAELPKPEQSTN